MAKYTVQLNYVATIEVECIANDEGEALEKANCIADSADMNEFVITKQNESQVLSVE